MKNIIFVCHGSICRSPAAEYIMKNLTNDFDVISRATSYEEIGNDIYPPMKNELNRQGIKFDKHYAQRISTTDFEWADYIFYMDSNNEYNLKRILGESDKIMPIYYFTPTINEIEDPWYTGNYSLVVNQLKRCIKDIIKHLSSLNK